MPKNRVKHEKWGQASVHVGKFVELSIYATAVLNNTFQYVAINYDCVSVRLHSV